MSWGVVRSQNPAPLTCVPFMITVKVRHGRGREGGKASSLLQRHVRSWC